MARWSRYLLVAVVAFAAALGATWLSRSLAEHGHPEGSTLHVLMHEQLNLDAAQQAKIEVLERQFAMRRKALDAQLRQANSDLASAIANEHQYGPKVAEAVDRSHVAMGDLQKATLSHVFAMRAVLRPDQAVRFDTAVAKALTRADDE
jgi:Spy/CpxP family protein refolding chaperone